MNKNKVSKKTLAITSILLGGFLFSILLTVLFSPYGYDKERGFKLVKTSILIAAPSNAVYAYLGNSENAKHWSVFVDHINPLNSNLVTDGMEGSIRRCFVNENEKGQSWDEEVLTVEHNKLRMLSCFGFYQFPITAGTLNTEQIYEQTDEKHCLLSLTLFFPPEEATFVKDLKLYWAAYKVADIFDDNLENIKKLNERIE